MFRGGSGHEHLASGAAVSAHGRISVYEPRGDLQCIVDLARPEGMGERYLELERLMVKLESEGLFEQSRKRPRFPSSRSGWASSRRRRARCGTTSRRWSGGATR